MFQAARDVLSAVGEGSPAVPSLAACLALLVLRDELVTRSFEVERGEVVAPTVVVPRITQAARKTSGSNGRPDARRGQA